MNAEKHCRTKIPVTIETLRSLWSDCNDRQRLEIVKSLILTAPDCHAFLELVVNTLTANGFRSELD